MKPTIHAFIISWSGRQADAEAIETALADHVDRLTVIHSDEQESDLSGARWRRVPNDWFYGRKFRQCLEEFDADIMLQIVADVSCADWPLLIRKCREAFRDLPALGVWGPKIENTHFNLDRTRIAQLDQSSVQFVTMVDSIVWAFSGKIIGRLRSLNYDINNLGWGIERLAALHCHSTNRVVVIDSSIDVHHPKGTGYDTGEAARQYNEFIKQATLTEKIHDVLISRFMETPGLTGA